jgi:outer membrane protein assembly factor BamB
LGWLVALTAVVACTRRAATPPHGPDAGHEPRALRAPPAEAPRPASTWWLTPQRTLVPGLEEPRVFTVGRNVLALGAYHGATRFDGGGERTFLEPGRAEALDWSNSWPRVLGSLVFGARRPSTLVALEAGTFREAWQLALPPDHRLITMAQSGDVLLVSASDPDFGNKKPNRVHALIAVDAKTGRELWRSVGVNPPDMTPQVAASDGRFWVRGGAAEKTHYQLLDAATGRLVWQSPAERAYGGALLVDHERAAIVTSSTAASLVLETRDAKTGALLARVERPAQLIGRSLLEGDVLYVHLQDLHAQHLTAFSAHDLRLLWQVPLTEDPVTKHGAERHRELLSTDGALVVCANATLRAFDKRTGAELWSYGLDLPTCRPFAVASGPRVYLSRTAEYGPPRTGDDTIIELAPSATPPETASVRGRIAPFETLGQTVPIEGARVLVGNQTVTADRDGLYEARVSSRGVLRVHVHLDIPNDDSEKCNPGAQGDAEITLDGSQRYVEDFELERDCW